MIPENGSAPATERTVTKGQNGHAGALTVLHSKIRPNPATLIRTLAELYPQTFTAEKWQSHRPLKIGTCDDLIASGIVTPLEASIALRAYCGRRMYLTAVAAGGIRVDLAGQLCGDVAPEAAEWARMRLAHLDARAIELANAARAAARKPAKPKPIKAPPPAPTRLSLADLRRAAQERRASAP
jgi:sRNA-binding protein